MIKLQYAEQDHLFSTTYRMTFLNCNANMKLTFRQYLESKEQLRKAIANTPITIIEYEVRKYCSIAIGESKEDGTLVGLKPKQKVIIQWRYDDMNNPTPDYVRFVGVSTVNESEEQQLFWTGQKLSKWLMRHAKEGQNHHE